MKSIGSFLIIAGVLSCILHFAGYNLKILMWIYKFPELQQWLIRGGVIVAGLVLFILGSRRQQSAN